MAPKELKIKLVTTDRCREDSSCCAEYFLLAKQLAVDGVSMALKRPLPGDALVFDHQSIDEFDLAAEGKDPPILVINGVIVLNGHHWTTRDVREAVEKVLPQYNK